MKKIFFLFSVFIIFFSFILSCNKQTKADSATASGEDSLVASEGDSTDKSTSNDLANFLQQESEKQEIEKKLKEKESMLKIETLAQQIELMKKGEWLFDNKGSVTKIDTSNMISQEDALKTLNEKSEFVLANGAKIIRRRISSYALKRDDDKFSINRKFDRAIPYDYRIGKLADLKSSNTKTEKIVSNLTNFFTSFANEKKIDSKYIHAPAKELVTSNLKYFIDAGALPDSIFRIGSLSTSSKLVRVNMRFYYNQSCADGEVMLEEVLAKDGSKDWLISDIQVDFLKLLSRYEGFSEPYLPSSYQYFDWE